MDLIIIFGSILVMGIVACSLYFLLVTYVKGVKAMFDTAHADGVVAVLSPFLLLIAALIILILNLLFHK